MGIPDGLTCLLKNLYAGQDATVRTEHGTTDWFQIRKRVLQSCILSPCLFNLNADYIMQHAGLDEVQFSCSVMSNSLWPHGPQQARFPCPSSLPGVYSNSCPLSQWCHPTISSSVAHFSSHLQSFPASGFFQMSQLFTSGGQSIGVSASNEYSGLISFRMDWLDLLAVQGPSRVFSNTIVQKHHFFGTQLSLWFNSHIYSWLLEKL